MWSVFNVLVLVRSCQHPCSGPAGPAGSRMAGHSPSERAISVITRQPGRVDISTHREVVHGEGLPSRGRHRFADRHLSSPSTDGIAGSSSAPRVDEPGMTSRWMAVVRFAFGPKSPERSVPSEIYKPLYAIANRPVRARVRGPGRARAICPERAGYRGAVGHFRPVECSGAAPDSIGLRAWVAMRAGCDGGETGSWGRGGR